MVFSAPRTATAPDRGAASVRLSAAVIQPSCPCFFFSSPSSGLCRTTSALGDAVVLLHVRPTSVLYVADWGSTTFSVANESDAAEDAAAGAAVKGGSFEEEL